MQAALAVLLPTEDLENACLRALVADVIAETILGGTIGGKVCEGWFIWSSIIKVVEVVKARIEPKTTGEEIEIDTRSRLEKFGLLSEKNKSSSTASEKPRKGSTFSKLFWRTLQYFYLAFLVLHFVVVGLMATYSEPPRSSTISRRVGHHATDASPIAKVVEPLRPPRAILSFRIFPLISDLVSLRLRMPWLVGPMSLLQHHLVIGRLRNLGATDGIIDQ